MTLTQSTKQALAWGLVFSVAVARAEAQVDKVADGLALQKARAETMTARGQKAYYTKVWDLSDLPAYSPTTQISGTLRLWGSNYIRDGNVGAYWEEAFKKFHPNVKFDYQMKTTLAAVPSLVFGVSDLGMGRKITFAELLLFQRYKNRDPIEVAIATGSFDVPGWQPAFGIVVHKDNPITRVTMEQLDYIFGAERLGGWEGTSWHPERARGPENNIRTWGQLGLAGEWKDKPVTPYGLNVRYHQATEISDRLLGGSDKWTERLRIYANYVAPDGKLSRSLNDDLAKDRYGIAYVAAPTKDLPAELKILELAETSAGPYVPYTIDSVRERTYPFYDEIYAYTDSTDGALLDPKVREYLRFIVSREGQAAVMKDGKYLPLTAKVARQQLAKLK